LPSRRRRFPPWRSSSASGRALSTWVICPPP
jgi:hypothetical protein